MEFKKTFPTPTEHHVGRNTCQFVILHHTGTAEGTINGVLDWLYRRADYASCHYVVDTNGDAYKIGNDTDILRHAGESHRKGLTNMNQYSIWIEIIWPLADGGFTDKQRETVAKLTLELCTIHKIPKENVLRHKDIAPGRKVDVADSFWNKKRKTFEEFKSFIFQTTQPMPEQKSRFTDVMNQTLKEAGVEPLFSTHEGDQPLTEKETRELIEIAFARFSQRLKK